MLTSKKHEEQVEREHKHSAQAQITKLKNELEEMKRKLVEDKQATGKNNCKLYYYALNS